jgi:hypothetical protein
MAPYLGFAVWYGAPRRWSIAITGIVVVAVAGAGPASANENGHFGVQRWSGQWSFVQSQSGATGRFGFRHETDRFGLKLLRQIAGTRCREPSDYFAGGYTIPQTGALGPGESYVDTGKIRGCTVGNPNHLVGRYQSDISRGVGGNIDLALATGTPEFPRPYSDHWTGTFTMPGVRGRLAWHGDFESPFRGDGAFDPSSPPYGTLAVTQYGKFFNPPNATVGAGAVVTLCNRDPFYSRPFSFSRYNEFAERSLRPDQCTKVMARNPTPSPIKFKIFDTIHSMEKLTLDVLAADRGGQPSATRRLTGLP